MILIDGKKAAAELREELKLEVSELKTKYNKVPGLTVILIGDMTPSQIYVRNKEKSANEVGLKSEVIKYPDTVEEKTSEIELEEAENDAPEAEDSETDDLENSAESEDEVTAQLSEETSDEPEEMSEQKSAAESEVQD